MSLLLLPFALSQAGTAWVRIANLALLYVLLALGLNIVVGYAGLLEHANGSAVAEHGLTVVRRDRRRRGIASALKRAQLEWAARSGLVELVTWTQKGNEAMQAINRGLGYVDHSRVLTYTGPLPPTVR